MFPLSALSVLTSVDVKRLSREAASFNRLALPLELMDVGLIRQPVDDGGRHGVVAEVFFLIAARPGWRPI